MYELFIDECVALVLQIYTDNCRDNVDQLINVCCPNWRYEKS